MDEYYIQLADALQERLSVIADQDLRTNNPAGHLEKLRSASERIDRLKTAMPRDADPMLVHYLQRSSFTKALESLKSKIGGSEAPR
jgi:hypothetical protein